MDPNQSRLVSFQESLKKLSEQQRKNALEIDRWKEQEAAQKMAVTLEKILSSSYDKAIAYNNAVIVAGYAAFFAIWSATKPALTHWISIATALLMVTSATIFIGYEIFKMVQSSRSLLSLRGIVNDVEARKSPSIFQSRMEAFEGSCRRQSLRYMKVWAVVLVVTVSTAVTAIGLLVYSYICALVG
ncbi:hypothetical protein G5B35_01980 [Parapusillimonas sp. SGNA-6]|nr:hypothetical protein [Parapusillimonas sp. SGNA-6]